MKNLLTALRSLRLFFSALLLLAAPTMVTALELDGVKTVHILTRDQQLIPIGSVSFKSVSNGAAEFALDIDHKRFTDHFLSMKEFKCVEGGDEILCHVPYPYKQPGIISKGDFAWLEHSLMFLFKKPGDFGAKLWNGLYYRLVAEGDSLVGYPQAVDLNLISAPPDDLSIPPYSTVLRDDVAKGSHWIDRLVIR